VSLEPGRKLGLTASLIIVIVPVITFILYGLFFLSLFGLVSSGLTGGSPVFGSLFPIGILIALSVVGIIGFVGFILFIISMHSLSQYYNEPGIFRNVIYSFLVTIIGYVALFVTGLAVAFTAITSLKSSSTSGLSGAWFIGLILGIVAAALVIEIVSALLLMRAFNKLGEKSGVQNFNTAGTLYLVGTVLTIVFIGSLIVWIAWIFAAMGFNSLKPKTNETTTFPYANPQTPPTNLTQKRFCPYCGIENTPDSIYCVNCGKKLQQS